MAKSGLGRVPIIDTFNSLHEYLEGYVFKIKDHLIEYQSDELKKRKAHQGALARVNLQKQKLDKAYEGLEKFRK